MNILRIVLGLVALLAGAKGFYTIAQAGGVLENNLLIGFTLLFTSTAFVASGAYLLIEPELKQKVHIKLGE